MMAHPENWTAQTRETRDAEIVSRLLAADEGAAALRIARNRCTRQTWIADDGNAEVEYDCEERSAAAQQYVDDGDWGEDEGTWWCEVYTYPRYYVTDAVYVDDTDNRESDTITVDPEEPECSENEHNWQTPHEIVGGLEENPGCWGHGGGVILHAVCMHCGCGRITDTWAQNMSTGEQGLTSVAYTPGEYSAEVYALREESNES